MKNFEIETSDISEGDLIQIGGGFFLVISVSEEEANGYPIKIKVMQILGKRAWGIATVFKHSENQKADLSGHFKLEK